MIAVMQRTRRCVRGVTTCGPETPSQKSRTAAAFPHAVNRGVTLVELVVVLAIVSILAAIIVPTVQSAMKRKAITQATHTVTQLALAFSQMKEDYRLSTVFGQNEEGGRLDAYYNNNLFVRELAPDHPAWRGYAPRLNARRTPYFEFKDDAIADGVVLDPWKQPYRYLVCVRRSKGWGFLVEAIYSSGPDRRDGNADDLVKVIATIPLAADRERADQTADDRLELIHRLHWQEEPRSWKSLP